MTTVKRARPTAMLQGKAAQFLALRAEATAIEKRKKVLNTYLAEQVEKYGDEDEINGHFNMVLPEPILAGGKEYTILQRQKRTSMLFDEDKAEEILREHDIYDEATTTVVTLDQDKVYALHQMGRISDEEMDSILVPKVTWALVPLVDL